MIKLDRPICIFDLEATGTNVLEDRIVDVCVLRREPDGRETVFSSLVNPGVPIPPEVTASTLNRLPICASSASRAF